MKKLFLIVWSIASIAVANYVSVFIVLTDGIEDIVNGTKSNPANIHRIVWGVIEVFPLSGASMMLVLCFFVWIGRNICFGRISRNILKPDYSSTRTSLFKSNGIGASEFRRSQRWPGDL
jgi:hypothetical protein